MKINFKISRNCEKALLIFYQQRRLNDYWYNSWTVEDIVVPLSNMWELNKVSVNLC